MRGIERRIAAGRDPRVDSVASMFVSRWDMAVAGQGAAGPAQSPGHRHRDAHLPAYCELLASRALARSSPPRARSRSGCCGRAPAPRIRRRRTRSTSKRWRRPTPSTRCPTRRCWPFADHGSVRRRDARGRRRRRSRARARSRRPASTSMRSPPSCSAKARRRSCKSWNDLMDCIADKRRALTGAKRRRQLRRHDRADASERSSRSNSARDQPAGRQARAPRLACSSMSRGSSRPTTPTARSRASRHSASRSARRVTAARRSTARFNECARAGDHARRSVVIASASGIDGPLFLGIDTHALSVPAFAVGARGAGGQRRRRDARGGRRIHADAGGVARDPRPQPRARRRGLADGIVVTPSHNPPDDGGFKYNPPNGGPADTDVDGWIEAQANALSRAQARRRAAHAVRAGAARARPRIATTTWRATSTISANVIDMDAIRGAGIRMGVDPLGGAGVHYWARDRRALPPRSDGDQRRGRSDVPLHDASTGTAGSAWIRRRRTRCSG